MKKGLFQRILPHLVAYAVFMIVALIYCHPVLMDKELGQSDVLQWKAAVQQSEEYKRTHGAYPLWTNALFSGMPTFQIGYPSNNYIPWWAHSIMTLGLPKPTQFFFLACICFYFLCIVLGVNPYIGIFGGLSFAYATYNPVIISVGHDTKMWSIAYMPALLGSIILVFNRRYWLGAALTALFTSVLIAMNHPQIAYYLFIAIAIMTVFFIVRWIRARELRHMAMALGFTIVAGIVGLLTNAVNILSTYEYQKETIRGGYSDLAPATGDDAKTGLRKDYAFDYSMGIAEPFVMMVPRMFGGSSDKDERGEKSKTTAYLTSIGQQAGASYYWGDIGGVGTSGPPYVGAVVCFLAILAMFVLDNKHKWWMFTTIILTIIMSWGGHFEEVNLLFYKYLPLYNKFRAPSMILVIPQLLLPALAVMGLHKIAFWNEKEPLWPLLKKGLIATGVVFAVLLLMYASFDFMSEQDKQTLQQIRDTQPQSLELYTGYMNALKEDRQALMLGDIGRTLGYSAAAFLVIWLLYKRKIAAVTGALIIAGLSFIDLMAIDTTYLNADNYKPKLEEGMSIVPLGAADATLQGDKSFFRVFNEGGSAFAENLTSYYYNSVGGYHPAKLRLYNDLIDSQLRKGNLAVYSMLNAKYFIQRDPQTGATSAVRTNPMALGNAWFIRTLSFVRDAPTEMKALDHLNPRDTAVVQESQRSKLGALPPSFPAAGTIQLVKNDNDIVTYRSSSTANEFAVFSEVYYEAGWKAFIDNKETPIVKVNYALRGLPVPAGNHDIVFRFEPQGYMQGKTLTTIFSVLLVLLLAAGIFFDRRSRRHTTTTVVDVKK
jgi:NADH:ubiquinone oxidoreductase subunit 6 (subunit J)